MLAHLTMSSPLCVYNKRKYEISIPCFPFHPSPSLDSHRNLSSTPAPSLSWTPAGLKTRYMIYIQHNVIQCNLNMKDNEIMQRNGMHINVMIFVT